MQVVNPDDLKTYTDDHPTGALAQRYLFQGRDGTPENFMFSIAETTGRFEMLRHRHNFDQFRMALSGDMSMGDGRALREGWLGYFPEGAAYGPQDDQAGPIALVLQFGGASGYGYMSPQQYRDGRAELNKTGHFDGAVYVRELEDGRKKRTFSINAIFEQAMSARLLLPTPRYDGAIFMNPAAYRWAPVRGMSGIFRKHLGTFSEREVTAEMWRLDAKGALDLKAGDAIRLLFVLSGAGTVEGKPLSRYCGVELLPGETAHFVGGEDLILLSFNLPVVGQDWMQPETESVEPVPGESTDGGH